MGRVSWIVDVNCGTYCVIEAAIVAAKPIFWLVASRQLSN